MSWETTGIGVAAPVVALAVAVMGYRRSRHVDRVTEQSGLATEARAGTAQVIEGFNLLIDNLQEDNKSFREDIRHLTTRLETITNERDELRQKLARLARIYGDAGITPAAGNPVQSPAAPEPEGPENA